MSAIKVSSTIRQRQADTQPSADKPAPQIAEPKHEFRVINIAPEPQPSAEPEIIRLNQQSAAAIPDMPEDLPHNIDPKGQRSAPEKSVRAPSDADRQPIPQQQDEIEPFDFSDDESDDPQYEENERNRELNIRKIEAYLQHFPDCRKEVKVNPKKLRLLDSQEIAELLNQVQRAVQNRNTQAISSTIFNNAMFGIESAACRFTPLKLQGFALACQANQSIQDSIIELQIMYLSADKVLDPRVRLAIGLLTTATAVHLNNRGKEEIHDFAQNAQVKDSFAEKYKDL